MSSNWSGIFHFNNFKEWSKPVGCLSVDALGLAGRGARIGNPNPYQLTSYPPELRQFMGISHTSEQLAAYALETPMSVLCTLEWGRSGRCGQRTKRKDAVIVHALSDANEEVQSEVRLSESPVFLSNRTTLLSRSTGWYAKDYEYGIRFSIFQEWKVYTRDSKLDQQGNTPEGMRNEEHPP